MLAKGIGATRILEIGTLWGWVTAPRRAELMSRYSTSFLTKVLPAHGQIDTLEVSPVHAKVAQAFFLDADLYPFPKVHIGPALQTLRSAAFANPPGTEESLPEDQRGYDLVFIDADKENIAEYFAEALRLTRKGGTIVVDNVIRGGRWVPPLPRYALLPDAPSNERSENPVRLRLLINQRGVCGE